MKIGVEYRTPTTIWVDTETGEIDRVLCHDGYTELDRDDFQNDQRVVIDEDGDAVKDQALRDRAVEIAETADHPAWEWGEN